MLKSDQPINTIKQDVLGRGTFVTAVSAAITSYSSTDSLSVGLYGKWGSGKTSVINLILEEIDVSTEDKPIIFRFNPWNFSDHNQLVKQFFDQLAIELGKPEHAKELVDIGAKLSAYSKALLPLTLIPQITVPVAILSKTIKTVGGGATALGKAHQKKSLASLKNELNVLLEKLSQKVVVVIDDIDRLNSTEIRQIFQLVKSVGDFSNTLYFLAFDRDVVVDALQDVQKGDGSEYLEKMIQVSYVLPQPYESDVQSVLLKGINEVIGDVDEQIFDKQYWYDIYQSGMKKFFVNIRDVNRYLNVLRFEFSLLKEEANIVDLLAVTAIKVFYPEIYSEISNNKYSFTGIKKDHVGFNAEENKADQSKEFFDGIFEKVSIERRAPLKAMLEHMFPKLTTIYGNRGYTDGIISKWRRAFRVCSAEDFDVYFKMHVASGEISRTEMNRLLATANSPETFAITIRQMVRDDKIIKFLDKIEDYTESLIPLENVEAIICTLIQQGDSLPGELGRGIFEMSTESRIVRIQYQLLKRINLQNDRFDIMRKALSEAVCSVFSVVDAVKFIGYEHEEKEGNLPLQESECIVSKPQLTVLQEIAVTKVKECSIKGDLIEHKRFTGILWEWSRFEGESPVKQFVSTLVETEKMLVRYLAQSLSKIRSTSSPYEYWSLSMLNVSTFIDPLEIIERVRIIKHSEEFSQLEKKEQLGVSYFIKCFDEDRETYSDHDRF